MVKPYYTGYKISSTGIPPLQSQAEPINAKQAYVLDPNLNDQFPGDIFSHGPLNYKLAALTFDDAPDGLFAPVMLDIFAHYDVKATFFCLGKCVHRNPEMLKRIAQDGHVIGNHTYDHVDITKIPPDQLREQVEKTETEIKRIIGVRTALFRPPYGFMNADTTRILISMGYKIIMWNIDSMDWVGLPGATIAARVIVNITPGAIILMHNACDGSVEAGTGTTQSLPYVIESLKTAGYMFTTVSTMLNIPAYQ